MSTPHIEAKKSEIAKIVLMPGDPLRAKVFAEEYLENYKQINNVRGMLGYTGTLEGKMVTVMGHGMGLDSIGLYAYELYDHYDVDTIIRFGSCGAYKKEINLWDIIIGEKAYSKSNYGLGFNYEEDTIEATTKLVSIAKESAKKLNIDRNVITTTINSSMWFYKINSDIDSFDEMISRGIDVVEMEGYALYVIAKSLNKNALVLLTVSDNLSTNQETTPEERRTGFTDMFNILKEMVKEL